MRRLQLALGFLTVLPVHPPAPRPGDLGRAAVWFPAVGLLLGGLLAATAWGLNQFFPALITAVLSVAMWAGLTGGLHLDGLADCGDGLPAAVTPERRLEIMRDPRLGTFGGASLCLFLLLKVAAVAALMTAASPLAFYALLFAPTLARWLMLLVARQPSARPGGMGAEFALGLRWPAILAAALWPLALVPFGGARAFMAVGLALALGWGIVRLARARLGGVTGDVLGLTVELTELITLLAFAAGS